MISARIVENALMITGYLQNEIMVIRIFDSCYIFSIPCLIM